MGYDETDKKRYFSDASGTISKKVDFCKEAIEFLNADENWTLNEDSEKLAKSILEFVVRSQ